MNYEAIEQEALNLPLDERDYLESLLWQSLKGLSPEEIERGEALNPAQMSAVMKNAESTIGKKESPLNPGRPVPARRATRRTGLHPAARIFSG